MKKILVWVQRNNDEFHLFRVSAENDLYYLMDLLDALENLKPYLVGKFKKKIS